MYIQGVISKNDRFRTIGFHSVLVQISSLRPITSMSLSDEAIKCVQKPKTNHVSLVSRDLNAIEQLLDELWRRISDRLVQTWNLWRLQVAFH